MEMPDWEEVKKRPLTDEQRLRLAGSKDALAGIPPIFSGVREYATAYLETKERLEQNPSNNSETGEKK